MVDISARTNEIVYSMFVRTADVNYLSARAAFFELRDWDFWWLTLHAVEKYLKAILLLNGHSARMPRGKGHDIPLLLDRVALIDARLSRPVFHRPAFANDGWADYADETFIRRLNDYGSADNRYGIGGYVTRSDDLFRVDQLVFWGRRHAQPLTQDWSGVGPVDIIDMLARNPRDWGHFARSHPLESLKSGDASMVIFERLNEPFFPDARHHLLSIRSSSSNGPFADVVRALENEPKGSEQHRYNRLVVEWALANITMSSEDGDFLRALLR